MNKRKVSHVELLFRTFTAFSIGCAVVWAVRLAVVAAEASEDARHALILVFLGWVLGGGRTTGARVVYPPPPRPRPIYAPRGS
jgi:hypothetical protein